MTGRPTRARLLLLGLVVVVLVAGCGSRVDRARLAATGGALPLSSAAAALEAPDGAHHRANPVGATPLAADADPGEAVSGGAPPDGARSTGGRRAVDSGDTVAARPAAKGPSSRAGAAVPTGAPSGAKPAGADSAGPTTAAPAPGIPGTPSKPGPAAAKAPILFGTLGTGSGVIGRAVQPIITANKAWSADVNARGGLAGHPVKLIFGDC